MNLNSKAATLWPKVFARVVFVLGLILSSQWLDYQKKTHEQLLENQFYDHATQTYLTVERSLSREQERLGGLAQAINLNLNLSRSEFDSYSKVLSASGSQVKALGWIQLIPSRELDDYVQSAQQQGYSITKIKYLENLPATMRNGEPWHAIFKYAYPYQNNQSLIGLDLFSIQTLRKSLYLADFTRTYIASEPEVNVFSQQLESVISIYKAVFRDNGEVAGYAVLLIDLEN